MKYIDSITPRANLHIKYNGSKRILQLRDPFPFPQLASLSLILLPSLTIPNFYFYAFGLFAYSLVLIICAVSLIHNVFFREKVIWLPATQELIIKSSKHWISSSSVISLSKMEIMSTKQKSSEFNSFFLIDQEQN